MEIVILSILLLIVGLCFSCKTLIEMKSQKEYDRLYLWKPNKIGR